jgi:hypothetical protein
MNNIKVYIFIVENNLSVEKNASVTHPKKFTIFILVLTQIYI